MSLASDVMNALVPQGCIPIGVVAMYSFLDADGDTSYGTYYDGDMNALEALGMIEAMKSTMMAGVDELTLDSRLPDEDDR